MKDYRITVKVRNNRILKAIEEVGGTPGWKWCKAYGLQYTVINHFINMTGSPINAQGRLSPEAARLCEVVGKLPEDLWSSETLYPLERNFSEIEMDHAEIFSMLPAEQQSYLADFSGIEQAQTKALLAKALATLTSKEERVIKMRFEDDLTLAQCAERMGVTPQRIRQIEGHALRKLRHPSRVGIFVDALDVEEEERQDYKKDAAKFLAKFCGVSNRMRTTGETT